MQVFTEILKHNIQEAKLNKYPSKVKQIIRWNMEALEYCLLIRSNGFIIHTTCVDHENIVLTEDG